MIQSINRKAWWNMSKTTTVDEVLIFWLNDCTPEQRYKKDADFDALIFKRFETAISAALWRDSWKHRKLIWQDVLHQS